MINKKQDKILICSKTKFPNKLSDNIIDNLSLKKSVDLLLYNESLILNNAKIITSYLKIEEYYIKYINKLNLISKYSLNINENKSEIIDINESKFQKRIFDKLKQILFMNTIIKFKFFKIINIFRIKQIILSKSDLINITHKLNQNNIKLYNLNSLMNVNEFFSEINSFDFKRKKQNKFDILQNIFNDKINDFILIKRFNKRIKYEISNTIRIIIEKDNTVKKHFINKSYIIITKYPIYESKEDKQIINEVSKIIQLYCLNSKNKLTDCFKYLNNIIEIIKFQDKKYLVCNSTELIKSFDYHLLEKFKKIYYKKDVKQLFYDKYLNYFINLFE